MRDFVHNHADYQHDSVVNERITYDLLTVCRRISEGAVDEAAAGLLLPPHATRSQADIPPAMQKADSYLACKVQKMQEG